MEFYRIELSPLLIIVLLLIFLFIYGHNKFKRIIGTFANNRGLKKSGYIFPRRFWIKTILFVLGLFFIVIALLQPRWGLKPDVVVIKGLDMVVVLDTSLSMETQDIQPDRFEFAKRILKDILNTLDNDRVGLIGFAGKAYYFCPLTVDYDAFKLYLDSIDIKSVAVPGTSLDLAIGLAKDVLKKSEGKYRVILVVSDGEDHSEKTIELAEELKKDRILIFSVGVGTSEGGPIPLDNLGGEGYKKDKKGNVVISKLNEDLLYNLSNASGGEYFRASSTMEGIEELKRELGLLKRGRIKEKLVVRKKERFQIPLFIGIILLSLEFLIFEKQEEEDEE